jgi:hypothetical protein
MIEFLLVVFVLWQAGSVIGDRIGYFLAWREWKRTHPDLRWDDWKHVVR